VVLFQFAPWLVFRPSSLDLIAACTERLPGNRIAVELRNKSWSSEKHLGETIAFEREHGLVHVVVDEPQGFPTSVPSVWEAISPDLAIVRLHGRNLRPGPRRADENQPRTTPLTSMIVSCFCSARADKKTKVQTVVIRALPQAAGQLRPAVLLT
jgi:uncharacterized protein YecE (DUF72 family)